MVTSLVRIFELLIYVSKIDATIVIDIFEANQGLFVLLLFVLNKQTREDISRSVKKQKKKRRKYKNPGTKEEETVMAT